jgi:outer membrane protein assembly factor BamB
MPNGSTSIARFDTRTDAWSTAATYAGTTEYTQAAADRAGHVYGYRTDGRLIQYDPLTDAVTYIPTTIASMRGGTGNLFETRLAYDVGTRSLFIGAFGDSELYQHDLVSGTTTARASIPESQLNDIFCSDRSGHIYAAGDSSGRTMFQYDIATDTWSSLPDLPIDHGNAGTCVVSTSGFLYVTDGNSAGFFRLPLDRARR